MLWWGWALLIAAVLLSIFMIAGIVVFRRGFCWDRNNLAIEKMSLKKMEHGALAEQIPAVEEARRQAVGLPAESVHILSDDGLRLRGRLILAEATPAQRGAVVLAHGFRSSGAFDFSLALPFYLEQGFDLLLIDQRAHGKSAGRHICFGVRESADVAAWSRFLAARYGDRPLVLAGLSMGATSVLLASSRPDLAPTVAGVVADCGFSSCKEEFTHFIHRFLHLPRFPLYYAAEFICRLRLGFGFNDFRTEDALAQSSLPVLLIHGEEDDFVLPKNSRRAFDAAKTADKTLLLVPGAGHGQSFLADKERYCAELSAFLARVAPPLQ